MKVKVLKTFRDKDDYSKVYNANSVVDLPAKRVAELKELSLVAEVRVKNQTIREQ